MKVVFYAGDGTRLEAEVDPKAHTFTVRFPVEDETLLEFEVAEGVELTISGPFGVPDMSASEG